MSFETTLSWKHLTIPLSATLPEPRRPILFVTDEPVDGQPVICGFYGHRMKRFYGIKGYWKPHQVLAWAYVDELGNQVRELLKPADEEE